MSDGVDRDVYTPQTPLAVVLGTPPYTVSIASGVLPNGLSLVTTGIISGTPTTVGEATFTLQISDSTGKNVISDPISIDVAPRSSVAIKLWDAATDPSTGPVTTPELAAILATNSVTLNFAAGDSAVLSSTDDGTGDILADNFITVNGANICVGGDLGGCFIGPVPLSPVPAIDVSGVIPIGTTTVVFDWRDFGGAAETSVIYLVTTAKIVE
jgi:hypothetical protein